MTVESSSMRLRLSVFSFRVAARKFAPEIPSSYLTISLARNVRPRREIADRGEAERQQRNSSSSSRSGDRVQPFSIFAYSTANESQCVVRVYTSFFLGCVRDTEIDGLTAIGRELATY